MALSCALCGVGSVLLGLMSDFTLYLVCMGSLGVVMPLYNVPAMTMLQATVDAAFMGRVFGVFTMISSIMMPLGMTVFGPLGDRVNIDTLLVGTGVFIALLSLMLIGSKTIREAGSVALH
jgi:DHA3 family macrolide efflux protein-like MFS transporter